MRIRVLFAFSYGLLTFVALATFYRGDVFCNRTSSFGFIAPVLVLSLAVTALDFVASLCGRALDHFLVPSVPHTLIAPVICMTIVGFGLYYLPSWVNARYGQVRFEDSIAGVSCLFTEGYGVMFLYLAPLFFAFVSLIRELILERVLRPKQSVPVS